MRTTAYLVCLTLLLLPLHPFQAHSEIQAPAPVVEIKPPLFDVEELFQVTGRMECQLLAKTSSLAAKSRIQKISLEDASAQLTQDLEEISAKRVKRMVFLVYLNDLTPEKTEARLRDLCAKGLTGEELVSVPANPACLALSSFTSAIFDAKQNNYKEPKVKRFWTHDLKNKAQRRLVEKLISYIYSSSSPLLELQEAIQTQCVLEAQSDFLFRGEKA